MCEMIARSCVCGKRTGICGGALCDLFGSVLYSTVVSSFFISLFSFLVCLYGFHVI